MLLLLLQKEFGGNFETQIAILEKGLKAAGQDPNSALQFPFYVPVLPAYKQIPNWCDSAVNWFGDIHLSRHQAMNLINLLPLNIMATMNSKPLLRKTP